MTPAEEVFVFAAGWLRLDARPEERDRLARWLVRHYLLAEIEGAALLAFDPPRGTVDLEVLAVLLAARSAARSAVPPSPEGGFPVGEVGDDGLSRAVEAVFDDYLDP